MASVEEFLNDNPDLDQGDETLIADSAGIRLEVCLSAVSARFVKFNHMGTDYVVDRADVVDIEARADPAVPQKAATLTVKRDAALLASYSITARDLSSALPFTMSRSPVNPRRRAISAREVAWRRARDYVSEYPSLTIYLTAYQTLSSSDSYCDGMPDDSMADDEREDY